MEGFKEIFEAKLENSITKFQITFDETRNERSIEKDIKIGGKTIKDIRKELDKRYAKKVNIRLFLKGTWGMKKEQGDSLIDYANDLIIDREANMRD